MLEKEQAFLTHQLETAIYCVGYEPPEIIWRRIPFSGRWGLSTALCFELAAVEHRGGRLQEPIKERAQRIANELADMLGELGTTGVIEATNGYLNFYFELSSLASQLVELVATEAEHYGQGDAKAERLMVEYSQPNTHKAFHVGHFRNVCLGHSVALIARSAGYDTITANYIGDIGMHVIKCLWCYLKYHSGQEPPEGRGNWLGELYAEADDRLEFREHVVATIRQVIQLHPIFARNLIDLAKEVIPGEEQEFAFTRMRLQYALDPNWKDAFDTVARGLASSASSPQELLSNLAVTVPDSGPDEMYHEWLHDLFQNQDIEAAHRYIQQICDPGLLEWTVRFRVPIVWQELRQWMAAGMEERGIVLESMPDILRRFEGLDSHIDWWQEIEIWKAEVKDLFQRWEVGDPELIALWERTRAWSLDEFNAIYEQIGAEFQIWFYESGVEEEGKKIVGEMIQKGIAEDLRPDGPVLVRIDELVEKLGLPKRLEEPKEYGTCLILRSDGTSLYSTKDLALAKRKFDDYGIDRSVYVVDVRQQFYFQQIFKVLELWGFHQAKNCYHLAYEMVNLPSGTISSRAGNIVLFEEFMTQTLVRAAAVASERNFARSDAQRNSIARAVALGAMKYAMLCVDNNKVITFDWSSALDFDGRSAPYIQYAHARACRILERAGAVSGLSPDFSYLDAATDSLNRSETSKLSAEINLLETISDFPTVVQEAAVQYKPHLVANYIFELATAFSTFYHKCDVLRGDVPDPIRVARLALVRATQHTLANGLTLLGIEAPELM